MGCHEIKRKGTPYLYCEYKGADDDDDKNYKKEKFKEQLRKKYCLDVKDKFGPRRTTEFLVTKGDRFIIEYRLITSKHKNGKSLGNPIQQYFLREDKLKPKKKKGEKVEENVEEKPEEKVEENEKGKVEGKVGEKEEKEEEDKEKKITSSNEEDSIEGKNLDETDNELELENEAKENDMTKDELKKIRKELNKNLKYALINLHIKEDSFIQFEIEDKEIDEYKDPPDYKDPVEYEYDEKEKSKNEWSK